MNNRYFIQSWSETTDPQVLTIELRAMGPYSRTELDHLIADGRAVTITVGLPRKEDS